jgi:cytochrome P450
LTNEKVDARPLPEEPPADLLDFTRPAFRRDPVPTYHALREAGPIHRVDRGAMRFTVLTRHADVVAVLRDPRMSVDRSFQPRPTADDGVDPTTLHPLARALRALSRVMLFRDPPDHTRLRGLVNKAFTPRMVEALRPRIQKLVDEQLAKPLADGGCDLVRDLAEPLPILVIAELLGLPASDRADLKTWSDNLAAMLDGSIAMQHLGAAIPSAIAVVEYMRGQLEAKRKTPGNDLLSAMLAAQGAVEHLSDDEIIGTAMIVLGAGHETTTNLIGNGVLALLRNPGAHARLCAQPELIESAVEEFLRFDSPVQATSRLPTEDVELCGTHFEKKREVALLLGAANHDPSVFAEPGRLDLGRRENRHASFGFGIHFCLGTGLARLEGQLAIGSLVAHAPKLALAVPDDALEWRPGWLLRGLTSLPVRF